MVASNMPISTKLIIMKGKLVGVNVRLYLHDLQIKKFLLLKCVHLNCVITVL